MSFLCATMIISGAPSDLAFFSAAQAAILPYDGSVFGTLPTESQGLRSCLNNREG
jgi:hypothetical protein